MICIGQHISFSAGKYVDKYDACIAWLLADTLIGIVDMTITAATFDTSNIPSWVI